MLSYGPKFTIVSAVHNKEASLLDYFSFIRKQRFDGVIELVLVNDCSTDASLDILRWARDAFSSERLQIIVLRNDRNLGNCISRNRGVAAASGEYICVIDADCCLSPEFIAQHVRGHQMERADVCIGPMGIDSRGRDIEALLDELLRDPKRLSGESSLQFPAEPTAFMNTVTRNFSISAEFLDKLAEPLFDEQFGYSLDAAAGFGWEDVEMGYRLYRLGASIAFRPKAISVHKTHAPEIPDELRAVRSARNFIKLGRKHPELPVVAIDWFCDTHRKISNWLERSGEPAEQERAQLAQVAEQAVQRVVPRPTTKHRRRVLTMRWHIGHQFDLWKLPYEFDMVAGLSKLGADWDYKSRPLPANARFVPFDKVDFDRYDMALLHFDEWALRPELCRVLSADWGATFKFLLDFPGPKIAVCHGTPLTTRDLMQPRKRVAEVNRPATTDSAGSPPIAAAIDEYRSELVDLLKDVLVVCNSVQAEREWRFHRSRTVWHGFDPLHYPPCDGSGRVVSVGDMHDRPDYRGRRFYEAVVAATRATVHHLGPGMPNTISKPPVNETYQDNNMLGLAHYRNYVQLARRYGVFFNAAPRSPMPRVRGEAMMLGQAVLTRPEHDSDMFIDHGYNGFISDDVSDSADILSELCANERLRRTVGKRARETALDFFHVNSYVAEWRELIENFLG